MLDGARAKRSFDLYESAGGGWRGCCDGPRVYGCVYAASGGNPARKTWRGSGGGGIVGVREAPRLTPTYVHVYIHTCTYICTHPRSGTRDAESTCSRPGAAGSLLASNARRWRALCLFCSERKARLGARHVSLPRGNAPEIIPFGIFSSFLFLSFVILLYFSPFLSFSFSRVTIFFLPYKASRVSRLRHSRWHANTAEARSTWSG